MTCVLRTALGQGFPLAVTLPAFTMGMQDDWIP
jgi:hypothetical protein